MAKVKLNPILEQVRGQVGDLVFPGLTRQSRQARRRRSGGWPQARSLRHPADQRPVGTPGSFSSGCALRAAGDGRSREEGGLRAGFEGFQQAAFFTDHCRFFQRAGGG